MKKIVLAFGAVAAIAASGAETFCVDAQAGSDANPGTAEKPFASIQRARNAVRKLKQEGKFPADGVTVELNGRFSFPEGNWFWLDRNDSGLSAAAKVTWRAGAKGAVVDGAYRLKAEDFAPVADESVRKRLRPEARDKVLVCDLGKFGVKRLKPFSRQFIQWEGMEFFAYGRDMTIARYPDAGWIEIPKIVDRGVQAKPSEDGGLQYGESGGTFAYEGDAPARWDVSKGVYMKGFWCHDWASETLRVAKIDTEKREITMEGVHRYGMGNAHKWNTAKRRYYVYNLLEELDAQGEWFLDHAACKLYFLPVGGEIRDAYLAVRKTPLIRLYGVENVRLEGIEARYTCGKAVELLNCRNAELLGLDVSYVSTTGVDVKNGTDCLVKRCRISQTGGTGLEISGGDRKRLEPSGNRVTECEIHHSARLSRISGPCLRVAGCGNRIDRNYFHDAPYIAVDYSGNDHVFEYNEVECAMMESGDGGGMYTGRDWASQGNIVRYNYLHHFGADGVELRRRQGIAPEYEPLKQNVMVMGLYLDDCDSGDVIYGNIFEKAGWAMFCGGGRDNKWRNNLCVGCTSAAQLDIRGVKRLRNGEGSNNGWDMLQKLKALNWQTPPWSERYPWLVNAMENEPKLPMGTEFAGNVAVGCKKFFHIDPSAEKVLKEKLVCRGNAIACGTDKREAERYPQTDPAEKARLRIVDADGLAAAADNALALQDTPAFKAAFPEFPRIPVEEIGLPGRKR